LQRNHGACIQGAKHGACKSVKKVTHISAIGKSANIRKNMKLVGKRWPKLCNIDNMDSSKTKRCISISVSLSKQAYFGWVLHRMTKSESSIEKSSLKHENKDGIFTDYK
jgi:hypothetical protein